MARVLFIDPNIFGMNMLTPAIALFAAILKKKGHTVELFDTTYYPLKDTLDFDMDQGTRKMEKLEVVPYDLASRGVSIKESNWKGDINRKLESFKPDLIAMCETESIWDLGIKILEEIKDYKVKHNVPVIIGGGLATFAPDLVIKNKYVDLVCVGEGENALIDICEKIDNKDKDFTKITNCWVKVDGKVVAKNPISKPVDINENPIIDIGVFEKRRLFRPMGGTVFKMFPVETIRGCPYTCRYCSSPDMMRLYKEAGNGSYFRKKRNDLVLKELQHFKNNLGAEYIYFWADTFLAMNNTEFEEFCDMYSEIKLPFWIETRPETISDHKIKRMKDVGLDRISFGVEHGNEEFRLKILDRRWKNKDIIDALKIPGKHGVIFSTYNITGLPYETKKLAFDTIELNRHIEADNSNIWTFTPFHGTPLRKTCEELGYLTHETLTKTMAADDTQCIMPQYPPHEIKEIIKCFNLYVKFPKNRWKDIEKAERDTKEGNRIFKELQAEYLELYMPAPNANPTGGIEDFSNEQIVEYDNALTDRVDGVKDNEEPKVRAS
jgi:radical SAM superfamily enzyme YgiQ (UPF0313 family)|tara:strand:+ start:158 stop:1807 length:1650 start_codon:yes stop_codon:yes gene_type:complete